MSSLSCILIPREDKGRDGAWKYGRAVEVEVIRTDNGNRRWRLIKNSSDGRYQFVGQEGPWIWRSEDHAMYLIDDNPDMRIDAILYEIPADPFRLVTCGTSLFGDAEGGSSDGPMYYYRLDFLCV
ncbi:MAG: hypothetical protein FIA97_04165 [Methylococcaceae bacterium]|nr:hypothetical protein [Methylococcaceae bacterium]